MALMLSPNLSRSPVSFEAELAKPIRFREAVSALHEIVVGDLRWKPKDHTAYREAARIAEGQPNSEKEWEQIQFVREDFQTLTEESLESLRVLLTSLTAEGRGDLIERM